ncbi:hypothetical protein INR49_003213, partial [Caranx melampygus]
MRFLGLTGTDRSSRRRRHTLTSTSGRRGEKERARERGGRNYTQTRAGPGPPLANISGSEPQLWPVGMVLEGSSEALCPPPSLELRPSCNKSQSSPPLSTSSQPHDGVFPEDKEPVKYGELIVL